MTRFIGVSASIGAGTDRELDIVNCATDHIQRLAILYPGVYDARYHVDVFQDARQLFFVSLTTKHEDIPSKDSRAVGVRSLVAPFLEEEAAQIMLRTKFVSEGHMVWTAEVKDLTQTGSVLDATTVTEHDQLIDRDDQQDWPPHDQVLDSRQMVDEDMLAREHEAILTAKQSLAHREKAHIGQMVDIMKLKKRLEQKMAQIRELEVKILPVEREAVKNMERDYFSKLRQHEDAARASTSEVNNQGD